MHDEASRRRGLRCGGVERQSHVGGFDLASADGRRRPEALRIEPAPGGGDEDAVHLDASHPLRRVDALADGELRLRHVHDEARLHPA